MVIEGETTSRRRFSGRMDGFGEEGRICAG